MIAITRSLRPDESAVVRASGGAGQPTALLLGRRLRQPAHRSEGAAYGGGRRPDAGTPDFLLRLYGDMS